MNYLFRASYNRVELLSVAIAASLVMNDLVGPVVAVCIVVAGGIASGTGQHFLERRAAK